LKFGWQVGALENALRQFPWLRHSPLTEQHSANLPLLTEQQQIGTHNFGERRKSFVMLCHVAFSKETRILERRNSSIRMKQSKFDFDIW
jgi:hypothetical protein